MVKGNKRRKLTDQEIQTRTDDDTGRALTPYEITKGQIMIQKPWDESQLQSMQNKLEQMDAVDKLPADQRMDFLTIVTPNFAHFAPAKMAMEHGFHVVIEKPIAFTLEEALELKRIQEATGRILCLTHTYSGYPLVKQAKQMVKEGKLGNIRKVWAEYPQGWLSKLTE